MSTKIKLMRRGKTRQPYYRIVVADSRTKRDGRSIEEIGKYHPKEDPSYMEVDAERVAYWLGVGAQPTDAVRAILRVTGDWQKFHNEPAPEPMKVKAAPPDRRAAFEAATQLGGSAPDADATTPKKKATKAGAKSDPESDAKPGPTVEASADVQVERAEKSDVEVDVEAQSPRAGARKPDAKKAAAPKAAAADDGPKGDPAQAGAPEAPEDTEV